MNHAPLGRRFNRQQGRSLDATQIIPPPCRMKNKRVTSFSVVMVEQLFAPQPQKETFSCRSGRPLVRKFCGSKRFFVAPVSSNGASLHFAVRLCPARFFFLHMPATACAGSVNMAVQNLPVPMPATACASNVNIPVQKLPAQTTAYMVVCTTGGNLCSLV